nr:hypothetical protein Iba_chr08cCG11710 [Ipomoea batatas]
MVELGEIGQHAIPAVMAADAALLLIHAAGPEEVRPVGVSSQRPAARFGGEVMVIELPLIIHSPMIAIRKSILANAERQRGKEKKLGFMAELREMKNKTAFYREAVWERKLMSRQDIGS